MRYLETLLLACLAVFAPISTVLITALVLVLFDTLTGVLAAHRRGEKITSTGFKRTVGKLALYQSAICMAFLCEQYLTGAEVPVCKWVTTMVGLVELKSILENLNSISGKNLFKMAVDKITQRQADK